MTPKPQANTLDEIMDNSHIPLFMRPEVEANIQALITEAEETGYRNGERYGRMNEHHKISNILTNNELLALGDRAKNALKRRLAEIESGKL